MLYSYSSTRCHPLGPSRVWLATHVSVKQCIVSSHEDLMFDNVTITRRLGIYPKFINVVFDSANE
jgi:hypothetical protein